MGQWEIKGLAGRYRVRVNYEVWDAVSPEKLVVGDDVEIISVNKSVLKVRKNPMLLKGSVVEISENLCKVRIGEKIWEAANGNNLVVGDMVKIVEIDEEKQVVTVKKPS